MANGYSNTDVLGFLDYLAEKGLMNQNTVVARKAAINKMFGILDPEEQEDVREVDLDELASRFQNLQGSNYTPKSLRVYKSRASSAVSDFLRYKKNPATFKVDSPRPAARSARKAKVSTDATSGSSDGETRKEREIRDRIQTVDIPVPLRTDLIVQLNGIPVDLTPAEAKKICGVVSAMAAVPSE